MPPKRKKRSILTVGRSIVTGILAVGDLIGAVGVVTNPSYVKGLEGLGALAPIAVEIVRVFSIGSLLVMPFWLAFLAYQWMSAHGMPVWENRIRWGAEGACEIVSVIVLGWSAFTIYQFYSGTAAQKATLTVALTYGLLGMAFGIIAVSFLSYDLYWAFQSGEWRMNWRDFAKGLLGARQYRTEAVKEFLSLLYQFHTLWVNNWEPKIRHHSLNQMDVDDISQLNSRLAVARSDMAAESSYPPEELNEKIKQFMKELGELSAFMPTVLQAMPRTSGPGYETTLQTAIEGGNKLVQAVDEITSKIKRAFPLEPETGF